MKKIAIPYLTTAEMIEVDRAMTQDYGIHLLQMMENAGWSLAHLARRRILGEEYAGKRVAVLSGGGANGGGALVAARRLHNWGADVHVLLSKRRNDMTSIARDQLDIARRIGISFTAPDNEIPMVHPGMDKTFDLILDGLTGYSLKNAPHGATRELIYWANGQDTPTLALDIPSGVDATTGRVYEPAIMAVATVALALPKRGLRARAARRHCGELYLADIGVPPALYARTPLCRTVGPLFVRDDIIRLW